MADPIKFKEDEIQELTDLRQSYVNTQNQLGAVKIQQVLAEQQYDSLTKAEDDLKQQYLDLTQKEQELVGKYNEKYGVGTVNIDSGEFVPRANEAETNVTKLAKLKKEEQDSTPTETEK